MAEPAVVGLSAMLLALRYLYPYPGVLLRAWISRQEARSRQDLLEAVIPLIPGGGVIAWSSSGEEHSMVCSWPGTQWHHQAQGLESARSTPWT